MERTLLLLLRFEILTFVVLLFLSPILLRRVGLSTKAMLLILTGDFSLVGGTYFLSLGRPDLFSTIPRADLITALALWLLSWTFMYTVGQGLLNLAHRK